MDLAVIKKKVEAPYHIWKWGKSIWVHREDIEALITEVERLRSYLDDLSCHREEASGSWIYLCTEWGSPEAKTVIRAVEEYAREALGEERC